MPLDGSLFGEEDVAAAEVARPAPAPEVGIADWQVAQVRRALDDTGLTDMSARQSLVEELAGRAVGSLGELRPSEARDLVAALQTRLTSGQVQNRGSSWDQRDEETWIDKL